ncbi:chorismate mutase [Rhodovulum kholense]|uniref:chorismate mutase n=1 Tax=Rhodovulum kholense TaxID=453584 RepID=A0A8E2VKS7_9RHOB|nr:chorismate mutase [Rhodovulum kholense]PTW50197.1 chorismate mutase [Rhodovulum kholense]
MIPPQTCRSMDELRPQIDALDARLVALLAERARYIDRAAELKATAGLPARIDDRVEEVVANVRALAGAEGLDPDLVETLWRALIEWSIGREERALGAKEVRG